MALTRGLYGPGGVDFYQGAPGWWVDQFTALTALVDVLKAAVSVAASTASVTAAVAAEATARTAAIAAEATARTNADALLIPLTQRAAANGVATLDGATKIPVAQVPDLSGTYAGTPGGVAATAVVYGPAPTGVAATDVANVQAAVNALPATGGRVLLRATAGTPYNFGTTTVTVPPSKQVFGAGQSATTINYTGTGYAFSVGNQTFGTALAYGCAVGDLSITLTVNGANGVELRETSGAELSNLYIEGVVSTNTSTGIFINGGNTANIFTNLSNIICNHIKTGCRIGSTGTLTTTSVTVTSFNAFGDNIAGSTGVLVDALSGEGSRFFGGNVEAEASGVNISGSRVMFFGMRFENSVTDVTLNAGASGNGFFGCVDFIVANGITNNSGNKTNTFVGCSTKGSPAALFPNTIATPTITNGYVYFQNTGADHNILIDAATAGYIAMQAGPGSSSLGGGLLLYGSSHATKPRDVVAGVLNGKFRVNGSGTDQGTDRFTVDTLTSTVTFPGALAHTGATVGFNNATAVGKRTLGAAATDLATVITLANNLRQALIELGLGQT